MLRGWGVTFTSRQFTVAMRQLTHKRVATPDATVTFLQFMQWWREFSAFGARRLLAIEFDTRALSTLKEVHHFLLLQQTLPPDAIDLYERQGALRSSLAKLESVVSLFVLWVMSTCAVLLVTQSPMLQVQRNHGDFASL